MNARGSPLRSHSFQSSSSSSSDSSNMNTQTRVIKRVVGQHSLDNFGALPGGHFSKTTSHLFRSGSLQEAALGGQMKTAIFEEETPDGSIIEYIEEVDDEDDENPNYNRQGNANIDVGELHDEKEIAGGKISRGAQFLKGNVTHHQKGESGGVLFDQQGYADFHGMKLRQDQVEEHDGIKLKQKQDGTAKLMRKSTQERQSFDQDGALVNQQQQTAEELKEKTSNQERIVENESGLKTKQQQQEAQKFQEKTVNEEKVIENENGCVIQQRQQRKQSSSHSVKQSFSSSSSFDQGTSFPSSHTVEFPSERNFLEMGELFPQAIPRSRSFNSLNLETPPLCAPEPLSPGFNDFASYEMRCRSGSGGSPALKFNSIGPAVIKKQNIKTAVAKFSQILVNLIAQLRSPSINDQLQALTEMCATVQKAWETPEYGRHLAYSLCDVLRFNGGLNILIENCMSENEEIRFASGKVMEQCMSTENRDHVVNHGLEGVVKFACTKGDSEMSRVGMGLLESLFKHCEDTCSRVIELGGLSAVLHSCRSNDVETLRHCAMALANLALYGGSECQQKMIKARVPEWLFPLAFSKDDSVKYYACLAISSLVSNKEIEAAVLKSGTLELVEPFVTSHSPSEFAKSDVSHLHGRSKGWLERLIPVLKSNREEARNLAAFHFAMEVDIKDKQDSTEVFYEIGAIDALKQVASCPNDVASRFAIQALKIIGEKIPQKLSQQVPVWNIQDVEYWIKQVGFPEFSDKFSVCQVDGDLLLQLTEQMLRDDLHMTNGILRRRFLRELNNLKMTADYSSCDPSKLDTFLLSAGDELSQYTYTMLQAGVDREMLSMLTDDHLKNDCYITNGIHRMKILKDIKDKMNSQSKSEVEAMDAFISYRRASGSQLASLLKVHLQLRGFRVFLDVERLEAGKFDNNLLTNIRAAKHFVLVLTPSSLDRCIADSDLRDWVHKEIVAALESGSNIVPVIDNNFSFPDPETLPEDMRAICYFNGVRWIHDYQDACVDKLERFLRGEENNLMKAALMNAQNNSQNGNSLAKRNGSPDL